jgi:hypothetical protein
MRTRWGYIVVALAACTTPSPCSRSCSQRSSATGLGDGACADWAARYCKRLESCAPLSISIDYGDVDACIVRNQPVCASTLRARATGATPATMAACALAYDSASCDDVVVGNPPEACHVPGALALGAACGDGSQCSGADAYCRVAADDTCGACSLRGDVGAACDSARDCRYGLVCYFTCMHPVAQGDMCDGMLKQCPETMVCLNYKCVVPAQREAACQPNADPCDHDHGLYCDPEAKVCSPYKVADFGAPCGAGTVCGRGTCLPDDATGTSRCLASVAEGSRCDATHGPACLGPAKCVNGQCRAPRAETCM